MRRLGLSARTLAASALLAAIIAAAFGALVVAIGDQRDAARAAERSNEVVALANELEEVLVDVETGARGYVISGDEAFLEPWRAARAWIEPTAGHLQSLITDPMQAERARSLADDIRTYLATWSMPLVETAAGDRARAAALVSSGGGKRQVDALRAGFARFYERQAVLTRARDERAEDAAGLAIVLGFAGLGGSLLLVVLFAGFLGRAIVRPVQRIAASAQSLAAGDLSTRAPEGGAAEVGDLARTFNAMAAGIEERDAAVRAARDHLQAVVKTSPLGIVSFDAEGNVRSWNPAAERIFGWSAEEAIGRRPPYVTNEKADEFRELIRRVWAGESWTGLEITRERRDGTPIIVSAATAPVRGASGEILEAVSIHEDVTERKRAEEAVRALNDELEHQNVELEHQTVELEAHQAELETAHTELEAQHAELERAIDELAQEKERVEALFAFGELLASEIGGESLGPRILQEICDFAGAEIGVLYTVSAEDEEAMALQAARGLDESRLAARVVAGDGLAGRALAERRPVSASHGETGLRVAAFGERVAVRHELHVPLLQGERALGVLTLARLADRPFSESEVDALEHLAAQAAVGISNVAAFRRALRLAHVNKAVIDATRDGISLVDRDGGVMIRNRTLVQLLAELGAETAGTAYEQAARSAALTSDPDAFQAFMQRVAADPEYEGREEVELHESGRVFELYTTPVRDPAAGLDARLFTVRERTAEREAERLKSELVATVSHELRTPLASILGFSELLTERQLSDDERDRYLETIHREARRLTGLVNDFLDLQRMDEGHFTLDLEPFDLAPLLHEEVELFAGQSETHTIELETPEEPLRVVAERDRIAQVLANLLSNAIKYSPAGGRVEVRAERGEGGVRVSVRDHGLGIPAEQQRRIFQKFFRVDTSDRRAIGGTGLGLAICREIVEGHGGRIGFDSVEGEGTTFWLELPSGAAPAWAGRPRVLVVEDDPAAAELLSGQLEAEGYEVEVAATGEDGLARARSRPPDAVCLDIGLAGELDGWQVLARLKEAPATAGVPVIVCTAGDGADRAGVLGAADFLAKPFSADQLRQAIARVLPERRGSVLVVDDDETVRRLVVETLAGERIELREAGDGEEALAAVAERRPDAIVLDLVMPGVDGFAVLERLQRDPATRSIPVIVLTAKRLSGAERAALSARAVSLLQKSAYSGAELRRVIRQALGPDASPEAARGAA